MAGKHIIADFYSCKYDDLNNRQLLLTALIDAAEAAGGKLISYDAQQFSPHGITAFVLISESHLSIHTYPEYGTAFIDVFTCGNTCHPARAIKHMRKILCPKTIRIKRIIRRERGNNEKRAKGLSSQKQRHATTGNNRQKRQDSHYLRGRQQRS